MASSSMSARRKCHRISLDVIKNATNNFDENYVLGRGAEGTVYFAIIKLGDKITQVAVKYLNPNSQGFENEINTMSKIQHQNIISLLGYCDESNQKFLIYEYMENKSLADCLKNRSSVSLSWMQLLHICLDVARGIQHLHVSTDEFPKGIIHRDIKPANILLDKDMVAKVSDFGIFKKSVADQSNSFMVTALKGTPGYFAPEYVNYHIVSKKTDVYALGVLLFQVLCRKKPWDRGDDTYIMTDEDLGIWAQQNVDDKIKSEISDGSLMAFAAIIGESLKKDPKERPTMDGVVLELEKALKYQECHVKAKKGEAVGKAIGADDHHDTRFCLKGPSMGSMSAKASGALIEGIATDGNLAEPDPYLKQSGPNEMMFEELDLVHGYSYRSKFNRNVPGMTRHHEKGIVNSQSQSEADPSTSQFIAPADAIRGGLTVLTASRHIFEIGGRTVFSFFICFFFFFRF